MEKIKVNNLFIELGEDGQATLLCETAEGDYRITPSIKTEEKIVAAFGTSFTAVDRKEEEQTKEEEDTKEDGAKQ